MDKNGQNRGGAREKVHKKVRLEYWDIFQNQSQTIASLVKQNQSLENQLTEQWEQRIIEFQEREKFKDELNKLRGMNS